MTNDLLSNQDRSVLVTGVSSGIGASIARHLVSSGYTVFGSVRKAKDADTLSNELGEKFQPLIFDIRNRDQVEIAQASVKQALDGRPLSGLVNNAGVAAFGPLECLADEDFEQAITVNLIGTRIVTNAFIPLLRSSQTEQAGKIINLSSLSGILNTPMNGAYCVAKHALESLGEVYRRELLPDQIDVVSLRSGPVQSEIWDKSKDAPRHFDHAPYQRMSNNASKIMLDAERDAIPASDIAAAVADVLEGRRRRTAYHFSKGALTARILASLPARIADRLIVNALNKP